MPSSAATAALDGRIALVTGAGVRVGRAIAIGLADAGAHVAVHYNQSAAAAEETCRTIRAGGGTATPFQADLATRSAAGTLVHRVVETFGALDVLVPSAANFERVELEDVDETAWDRSLELNLTAPFFLARAAMGHLRRAQGAIVFITCSSTAVPFRDHLPYVVSKGALRQAMRALALELAPEVRVNAVAPGTVLAPTPMSDEEVAALARPIPLQRTGTPEDVARAVVFLATAPFITGQELYVDGGRSLAAVERYA